MIIEKKKKRKRRNGLSVRQKLPSESIRPVHEAFSTSSNIKTLLTELFTFFYTHLSVSASAVRASEPAREGERAERLFSRSGFISSLTYSGAVTEVSLGTFVGYTYMHLHTHRGVKWKSLGCVSEPGCCADGIWYVLLHCAPLKGCEQAARLPLGLFPAAERGINRKTRGERKMRLRFSLGATEWARGERWAGQESAGGGETCGRAGTAERGVNCSCSSPLTVGRAV